MKMDPTERDVLMQDAGELSRWRRYRLRQDEHAASYAADLKRLLTTSRSTDAETKIPDYVFHQIQSAAAQPRRASRPAPEWRLAWVYAALSLLLVGYSGWWILRHPPSEPIQPAAHLDWETEYAEGWIAFETRTKQIQAQLVAWHDSEAWEAWAAELLFEEDET